MDRSEVRRMSGGAEWVAVVSTRACDTLSSGPFSKPPSRCATCGGAAGCRGSAHREAAEGLEVDRVAAANRLPDLLPR